MLKPTNDGYDCFSNKIKCFIWALTNISKLPYTDFATYLKRDSIKYVKFDWGLVAGSLRFYTFKIDLDIPYEIRIAYAQAYGMEFREAKYWSDDIPF